MGRAPITYAADFISDRLGRDGRLTNDNYDAIQVRILEARDKGYISQDFANEAREWVNVWFIVGWPSKFRYRAILKAMRRKTPRLYTERMISRHNEIEALADMAQARRKLVMIKAGISDGHSDWARHDFRVALHNARAYRKEFYS